MSTPFTHTSSPPDDPPPSVIPGSEAQAGPSSADTQSAGSNVVTNLAANQHPKHMVRCWVLADQTDNIEGCSAKHCKDPNHDMLRCWMQISGKS